MESHKLDLYRTDPETVKAIRDKLAKVDRREANRRYDPVEGEY